MNKEELVSLGLTEEQATKVLGYYPNMVTKTRLNEVISERDDLKNQLSERDNQLKELAKVTKDNEELNSKIKELQETNKTATSEYESKLARLRLDNGIELALTQGGALNNKAVKALLNMDSIKFENDKLVGLDEQLKALKESDAYLFKGLETPPAPSGFVPQVANDNTGSANGSFKTYEQILSEM